jgi:Zn-dependent protease
VGYQRFQEWSGEPPIRSWQPPTLKEILVHIGLILLTLVTCTMAGTQWAMLSPLEIGNWGSGLSYAVLAMSFLLAHEYGHYIAAMRHGINSSLPYLIPVPPTLMPFGTFGAVIRTRSPMMTRNELFDVGVSGPLAGFAACLVILVAGFLTLPPESYLLTIHPEYAVTGIPTGGMTFDNTLLFELLRWMFSEVAFVPPMNEIYHYPFLCVGWFGLFVTSLNMLPFGQLDGGHVLYALIGNRQRTIARFLWWSMFALAVLWLIGLIHSTLASVTEADASAWMLWLKQSVDPSIGTAMERFPWLFQLGDVWVFWLIMIRFVVKIDHPDVPSDEPLSKGRRILGWTSLVVLLLCFAPRAVYIAP